MGQGRTTIYRVASTEQIHALHDKKKSPLPELHWHILFKLLMHEDEKGAISNNTWCKSFFRQGALKSWGMIYGALQRLWNLPQVMCPLQLQPAASAPRPAAASVVRLGQHSSHAHTRETCFIPSYSVRSLTFICCAATTTSWPEFIRLLLFIYFPFLFIWSCCGRTGPHWGGGEWLPKLPN